MTGTSGISIQTAAAWHHKDSVRASKTNSNTDVLDSTRAQGSGVSRWDWALLVWNRILSGLTVKFIHTCCGWQTAHFTFQSFINNQIQQDCSQSWSWKDFWTTCYLCVFALVTASMAQVILDRKWCSKHANAFCIIQRDPHIMCTKLLWQTVKVAFDA